MQEGKRIYPKIYVTGDTHGMIDSQKLNLEAFPVQTLLTRQDYVIITGDFGGVWTGTKQDDEVLDWYSGFTVLFADGNHEGFDALERYPIEEWNGGQVHRIRQNILHLVRGQVFDLGGLTFFVFGGALSVDKTYRMAHISWWPQEIPSKAEDDEALRNLERHNFMVGFVVTHTAPTHISEKLTHFRIEDPTCRILDRFEQLINYKKRCFGHYHRDVDINGQFVALFNRVVVYSLLRGVNRVRIPAM